MAKGKFVETMRKLAEMSVKDVTVQFPRPLKGIRNAKNIAATVGVDGVLALWRLFLAHNLPNDYVFLLTCVGMEIRVIPLSGDELRAALLPDALGTATGYDCGDEISRVSGASGRLN